jgi:primosomal replication protein N
MALLNSSEVLDSNRLKESDFTLHDDSELKVTAVSSTVSPSDIDSRVGSRVVVEKFLASVKRHWALVALVTHKTDMCYNNAQSSG